MRLSQAPCEEAFQIWQFFNLGYEPKLGKKLKFQIVPFYYGIKKVNWLKLILQI